MPTPCRYCGTAMVARGRRSRFAETTDHIVPRSKIWVRGSPGQKWHNLNCVAVCSSCNTGKGDMWPLDYLVTMPEYGVRWMATRLRKLECPQEHIAAALEARALAVAAASAIVAGIKVEG